MGAELQEFRVRLDEIDKTLVGLLAERFKITRQVGEYKRDRGIPPVDPVREAAQMERIQIIATEVGLNPDFAQVILRAIINQVVEEHTSLQEVR